MDPFRAEFCAPAKGCGTTRCRRATRELRRQVCRAATHCVVPAAAQRGAVTDGAQRADRQRSWRPTKTGLSLQSHFRTKTGASVQEAVDARAAATSSMRHCRISPSRYLPSIGRGTGWPTNSAMCGVNHIHLFGRCRSAPIAEYTAFQCRVRKLYHDPGGRSCVFGAVAKWIAQHARGASASDTGSKVL